MKTKLRRFVSILSAMVLMVCCAVPAFAFSNSDLPLGSYKSDDDFTYKEIIPQLIEKYPDYFKNYVFMLPQSDSSFSQYGFYWFNCDESKNFEIVKNGSNYRLKNTDNKPFKSYRCFWNYRNNEFSQVYLNGESSADCDYSLSWQIYSFGSNCNVKIGDDVVIKDPNAPPIPFTVDYSPSLKTGLVRKGTLIAPGASNDGQDVETNTIAVTVKLTDAFLNASKPISGAYTYSYQFTCFVVPSEYKDSDIKTMSEHAIYTPHKIIFITSITKMKHLTLMIVYLLNLQRVLIWSQCPNNGQTQQAFQTVSCLNVIIILLLGMLLLTCTI